jgi:hypothetical protein
MDAAIVQSALVLCGWFRVSLCTGFARAGCLPIALAILAIAGAPAVAEPGSFDLTVEAGVFSLNVSQPTALRDILAHIATAIGADAPKDVADDTVQPMQMAHRSLRDLLERIIPGHSFVLELSQDRGGVRRIHVINASGSAKDASGPVAQTAADVMQPAGAPADRGDKLREVARMLSMPVATSLQRLRAMVAGETDLTVRIAAVQAMAGFKQLGAVPVLESLILTDRVPRLRVVAATALLNMDPARAKDIIERAVITEHDEATAKELRQIQTAAGATPSSGSRQN